MRSALLTHALLLGVVSVGGVCAQAIASQRGGVVTPNTWSARSSTGLTLGGTWTASPDPATGAVRGSWTLVDTKGSTVARGNWSAAKSPSGWSGSWRAVAAGQTGEYAGTWSATVTLKPNAGFAELFEHAVKAAVGGSWRAGGRSGTWSIRAVGSASAITSAPGAPPPELVALTTKAGLIGAVTASCRAEFRAGQPSAFAVAVSSGSGGRYIAIEPDGRSLELARFTGRPDLACYTRAQADDLARSVKQSQTIDGQVTPRFNTTVVCGFIDEASARCWQYSPADSGFVEVGRWTT